jgi:prepilin-type processing-associated H-X9-DG protein
LIELIVVIAVIAVLAALLFPVFAQARAKAREAVCLSNFKQQATGIMLYMQDYDQLMPAAYYGDSSGFSPPDMLLGQFLQPYLKNMQVFDCPGDPVTDDQRATIESWPPVTPMQRSYNLAIKNNFSYNLQYLCPVVANSYVNWVSIPTPDAQLSRPANTILGTDSNWNRDANGVPYGGGYFFVDPPCRYDRDGADSFPVQKNYPLLFGYGGWYPSHPLWWNVYGGAWAWHSDTVTVAFCDGHVKALNIGALTAGCDVKDYWGGVIYDQDAYLWGPH